ncbi:NAD-dependent epimerase/dehydratase family protein [Brachyspira hyodysenteriae]|uniref:NAD-dependent epimerase/dehydratase family protein n=1 Tax=Brachyspira hyodysenteriae TaxID=159 RepID=UPI001ADD68F1|nr:NAD(P)-dependent oxidoreductase [Brachyspira hyodysenteriae]MDA0080531.1 NAD(P)-dependent oxidoreductase [Brachyspira hyodysenteriae]QTM08474.1 NAD-dependent epimerase/dehydratase family protein [Brachyspira hyodysenteriae]
MKYTIALTGASGNMGLETLRQLMEIEDIELVKLLIRKESKKAAEKFKKQYGKRVEIIIGYLYERDDCEKLLKDCHYVLNLAAVIPPKSDRYPKLAHLTNFVGVKHIVDILEAMDKDKRPKLVHISTVALYGNRNEKHPWGRVGDPLLISPYDAYSFSKLKGERYVLDSSLENRAIIRQTAMLHNRMLTDNMSDGLMFHTCYNAPLEWATARDSGLLMKRIIEEDIKGNLDDYFWKGCFNLGSKAENRLLGYDTFNDGFKLIGGSTKTYMKPNWNATRNFHGLWYYDGYKLEELFSYQKESVTDYWNEIGKTHWYYSFGKIVPPSLISFFAIQRLLPHPNSPTYWRRNGEDGKVIATFGSLENFDNLPKKWENFNLLFENKDSEGNYIDYKALLDIKNAKLLNHGYDESKKDSEIDIEDLKKAAEFRGGKLLSTSMTKGDLHTKLKWACAEGHEFEASPFTVIKAGHWCEKCMPDYTWNFDMLAKKNPYFAQVWYDSHKEDENMLYYFDEDFKAHYKKVN